MVRDALADLLRLPRRFVRGVWNRATGAGVVPPPPPAPADPMDLRPPPVFVDDDATDEPAPEPPPARPVVVDARRTPNPHAMKLVVNRRLGEVAVGASSTAEAGDHPVARALVSVEGVRSVYVTPDFATVTKEAEADWDELLPRLRAALSEVFGGA